MANVGNNSNKNNAAVRGATQITSNNASVANTGANNARIVATTVLAIMLRYATYIQPPNIRSRDEHIVPNLVALLRENIRMDTRLKRRLIAALGETIFYISAQEEEGTNIG